MKKTHLIVMVLTAVVMTVVLYFWGCKACLSFEAFKPENIRAFIQGFGPMAIVVYVGLYILNTFSPFFPPIFIMSLAAGAIFGPILGTIALTLGTLAGTTTAFFAARYLGRSWAEKMLKKNSEGKGNDLYDKLSENGFFILLPARIVGFPPYGIIDFICGLSKMKYRDFFMATLIGTAPWIITQVLLADRFANFNPKDPVLWGLLIVFILMIVITGKVVKKKEGNA